MNLAVESIKKAFIEGNIKALIEFWTAMSPDDKCIIMGFLKNVPENVLKPIIDKVKLINEYVAEDIMQMFSVQADLQDMENTESDPDIKIKVNGSELSPQEVINKCQEDPTFVRKFIMVLLKNHDEEFIASFLVQITLINPMVGTIIRNATQATQANIEEMGGLEEDEKASFNEVFEEMFNDPEKAIESIMSLPIMQKLKENPEKAMKEIMTQVDSFIVGVFDKYADVYEKTAEPRKRILKAKAKTLGDFGKDLIANGVPPEAIGVLVLEEQKRLNKRFQIV